MDFAEKKKIVLHQILKARENSGSSSEAAVNLLGMYYRTMADMGDKCAPLLPREAKLSLNFKGATGPTMTTTTNQLK